MREILFRGKPTFTEGWVYGYYCKALWADLRAAETDIMPLNGTKDNRIHGGYAPVDKKTVGQYTGIKDKNGTRIFEGDILHFEKAGIEKAFQVMYYEKGCKFRVKDITKAGRKGSLYYDLDSACSENLCVVGNIYDNPELMNKAQKEKR